MADIGDVRDIVMNASNITEFQRKVYLELLNVPCGETISYGELARRVGCGSAQAVGQALRRNPFAPDVPCHRVVASNGKIGGFGGEREGEKIEQKKRLLEIEKALVASGMI
ncbi:MAG: MGMT family protein [Prevotellaceae bacterium]|nr:MGMT family protein [Prevotellaceae bacterium]